VTVTVPTAGMQETLQRLADCQTALVESQLVQQLAGGRQQTGRTFPAPGPGVTESPLVALTVRTRPGPG
jgi:hypothetical protein